MSPRDFASKAIEGGVDKHLRISTASACGTAHDLLSRALIELRGYLESYLECGSDLIDYTEDSLMPRQAPENRSVIEAAGREIALIRDIESYLGKPFTGPDWLDEIIAQGPDWAGGAS